MAKAAQAVQAKDTAPLVCPFCGDDDGSLLVNLSDRRRCECGACSKSFFICDAIAHIHKQLEIWEAVELWLLESPSSKLKSGDLPPHGDD